MNVSGRGCRKLEQGQNECRPIDESNIVGNKAYLYYSTGERRICSSVARYNCSLTFCQWSVRNGGKGLQVICALPALSMSVINSVGQSKKDD